MITEALEASCGARISTLIPWESRFSHWATCLAASLSVTWTRRSTPFFLAAASIVCLSLTQRSSRCVGSESPIFGPAAWARGAAAKSTPATAARIPIDALMLLLLCWVWPCYCRFPELVVHSILSIGLHRLQACLDVGGRRRVQLLRQLQLQIDGRLALPGVVAMLRRILLEERQDDAGARPVRSRLGADPRRILLAPAGLQHSPAVAVRLGLLRRRKQAVEDDVLLPDRFRVLAYQRVAVRGQHLLDLGPDLVERLLVPDRVEPRLEIFLSRALRLDRGAARGGDDERGCGPCCRAVHRIHRGSTSFPAAARRRKAKRASGQAVLAAPGSCEAFHFRALMAASLVG